MAVVTASLELRTKGKVDVIDLTGRVGDAVKGSGLKDGIVTVFVPGATGAVSTIEYEPGLLKDLPNALERVAPSDADYEHHKTWGCDNGSSHVRATLIGPSLVVPFQDGRLLLGTWQQIVFIDLDTSPRERKLLLQILGE